MKRNDGSIYYKQYKSHYRPYINLFLLLNINEHLDNEFSKISEDILVDFLNEYQKSNTNQKLASTVYLKNGKVLYNTMVVQNNSKINSFKLLLNDKDLNSLEIDKVELANSVKKLSFLTQ